MRLIVTRAPTLRSVLDDGDPERAPIRLVRLVLKARQVQNPGVRGGKFHLSRTGQVVYGEDEPAVRPDSGPMSRRERRRLQLQARRERARHERNIGLRGTRSRAPQGRVTAAVRRAAALVREHFGRMRTRLAAHVRRYASPRDLTAHAFVLAARATQTWHAFEHHLKHRYGLHAEEVVMHVLIEVPHLVEVVHHLVEAAGPMLKAEPERRSLWRRAVARVAELLGLAKAEQLSLFDLPPRSSQKRKPVQRPGIRGGRYWIDDRGNVRYDERPEPRPQSAKPTPEPSAQQPATAESTEASAQGGMREQEKLELLKRVMLKLGIHSERRRAKNGSQYVAFWGRTYDQRATFRQLKERGLVWGFKDYSGQFYWACRPEAVGAVIKAFGGPDVDDQTGGGPEPAGARPGGRGDDLLGPRPGAGPGGGVSPSTGRPDRGPNRAGTGAGDDASVSGPLAERIAELASTPYPTPRSTLPPEVSAKLVGRQREDVALMLDAINRGDQAFLLGNQTGTGKTYVALGLIAATAPRRGLVIVPNQGIAKQWADAGQHFGLTVHTGVPKGDEDGVFVTTYAALRKADVRTLGTFDLTIADEVHREAMKTGPWTGSRKTARMVDQIAASSRFTVYSTATPFETPYHLHYLERLGLWPSGEFRRWTEEHGVVWRTRTVYNQHLGREVTVEEPAFVGTKDGRVYDMLRIRSAIIGQGKGVFRDIEVDQPLHADFTSVAIQDPIIQRAITAMDDSGMGEEGVPPLYKAAYVSVMRRLLDYAKVDRAVDEVVDAVRKGQSVAVFVTNRAPFSFRTYIDMERRYRDWEVEVARFGQAGAGPPPCSRIVAAIGAAFEAYGMADVPDLPGPVDLLVRKLRERLGEDQVEEYSGDVSAGKRQKVVGRFQRGQLPVVVSTIAAGGTGLSLHDTTGDHPRTQVNLGLPWTGRDLSQLLGRTYRVGTASPVRQVMMVTEHPEERRVAGVVAGRLSSMRAGVNGIVADTNVQRLMEFELLGTYMDMSDEADLTKALLAGAGLEAA